MNTNSEIKTLLLKFVSNTCNPEETNQVIAYYRNNKLTDDFPSVAEIQNLLLDIPDMEKEVADKLFDRILTIVKEEELVEIQPLRKNYTKYISIAASFLILVSVGWTFRLELFNWNEKNSNPIDKNQITLQLENGSVEVLSEKNSIEVKDAKGNIVGNQNGNKIIYASNNAEERLAYNILKIPYGKRFHLQLSDGTTVHLNSGTTLKYPVKFITGLERHVFLDGEAYFDVSKDKKHPFIVNANQLNVRVLGTQFNVSNYPEDDLTDVVLVEGLVGIHQKNEKFNATENTILKPGFKGSFNKQNEKINTKAVHTDIYTSWINGGLTFKNMTFKNIITKLERKYNVEITNKNDRLANEKFNASFGDEPIEKVLSYFNDAHGLNYTIKNKQITIK